MTNEELIKNHSGDMIKNLVIEVISKEKAEIRFEFEDNDQWAVVTTHIEEEDKEISLRMHSGDRLFLYLGYYDANDEFLEILQELTPEEKTYIPNGMKKIMAKVLTDEEGMRVPGSLLSK